MGKRVDPETDFEYIKYFRRAAANETNPIQQKRILHIIQLHEAMRDFFGCSLRQINHLIQYDEKPNLEIQEPRWEIYKISISFDFQSNIIKAIQKAYIN